ncbi:uncharacterized protein FOMMEDRAFT_30475 [Fomitiporia mediterranea MF3/22]|uniref:uncharacterized protein n=1 Tax=Fomitiporia mediterranea (strain MF3/22) TaxID=694068 RepID=UPI0004409903|nr:uncharacterized protein FOMMEDRAFT_30475 [Fomitiporia mediterranea MF3/22]EJD00427.1 hypothetical protein FOMMEDRAFT_30475 [Fomitiporia mediterranea MF3/22]
MAGGEQHSYDQYDVEMHSASRPLSPTISDGQGAEYELESVTCQWQDCGRPFSQLQALIDHIHNDHIGMNKSNYTCEWATCSRRGIQQASRFALISHIRAHTGEKPFTCPLPECDKSFTRSDAMAKHMRLQHNISPPLPGRGGSRKRKRDEEVEAEGGAALKVEGNTPTDLSSGAAWADYEDGQGTPLRDDRGDLINPSASGRGRSPSALSNGSGGGDDHEDALPEHLLQHKDPTTGKITDRTPAMVRYLLMKAKHRFVLEQHESLLEELRVVRAEERRAREQKEIALDEVIRAHLGSVSHSALTKVTHLI